MRVALTDKFCRQAKPGEWFDEKATGLALWVGKNRKTWNLHFSQDGKRGQIALGHHPRLPLRLRDGQRWKARTRLKLVSQ
jgi:hypothetical protein